MVELSQDFQEKLRAKLSKTVKDPFEVELLVLLTKIHKDLAYAEKDHYRQMGEIIGELQAIRSAIESAT